ncbi:hypothetical protein TanjilG_31719 [Lupinus angustifolius]|uniref:Uncharacterized protein n=1 Tax=Lupinus angustifolius TaxID=3871 RepID=A0A4P1RMD4_LUPAN|nr:PREDICTED: probable rRNA-processing protein EBP2 homolog [Lupinus angustifolius]XP_019439959.1 PREDICTED: probable rRNA-processing protein EBP2 homolog [Lupinus angustifolius]OIW13830.1 hypothetical protein TanjilG_31719 [Lupinus angustifolius]
MEVPLVNDDTNIDNETEDLNEEMSPSESEDEVKLSEPSENAINNRDALLDKLGDISWPENVDWIHKLSIDIDQEQEVDVNDDLARELAFYTQALEGARQAFEKLQSTPLRPPDCHAEMVKTDYHMVTVKGHILAEKKKVEEVDDRRKVKESQRLAKENQAQKLKERADEKKEDIESVKNWRKQRQQSRFADSNDDADTGLDLEDGKVFERSKKKRPGVSPDDRSGGKAKQTGGKGKFQKKKDSKFGFGGKKGMKKQNSSDTTSDFGGFKKGVFTGNKKRKR